MTALDQAPATGATVYAARLSPRRIRYTTIGVLAGMFLAGVDATVVATAMPTVVRELGGISSYAWVFSAYLLAEVATIPLWGRLADMVGRKRVFLAGMAVFLVGSALSGMSQSMTELIAFRAVQGIGAGCLLPVAQTIFGDLFTMQQRVRMSALFSSVFAFASVVGPLLGGFLTDNIGWRWVFYVNLPIGIAAMVLVQLVMIEPLQRHEKHSLDWIGAGLLVTSTIALMWALEVGGRDHPWVSVPVTLALATAIVGGVLFVWHETRTREPVLPMSLFRHGVMRPVLLMSFLVAVPMFAVVSYLPLFMTVVNGASATGAGRILTPLMLGSIVASFLGGRAILRFGYRPVVFAGMCLTLAGLGLLTLLDEHSGQAVPLAAMVVLGLGMGGTMVVGILVAQNSVEMDQRGSASSTVNFVRQLGATLGVAIGGSVFLSDLSRRIEELFGVHVKASTLLQPRDEGPGLTRAMEAAVRNAFAESLGRTFVTAFVIGVVASVSAFFIPRGRPEELHDVADGTQTDPTRPPASQTTV